MLAVIEALGGGGIVLDEQDLGAGLEFDVGVVGIGHFGEGAGDVGGEAPGGGGDIAEAGEIDAVGLGVVGAQGDVAFVVGGGESGEVAAVEFGEGVGGEEIFADEIEQVEEAAILLAVDLGEFDAGVVGFAEGAAAEEVGGVVAVLEQRPFGVLHHGGELLQVADHQELDAAEGLAAVAVAAQDGVDGVEEVGADHADFVDDEQVHAADHGDFVAGEAEVLLLGFAAGEGSEGELEEGVEGDAAGIDGGDAGGGGNDHLLGEAFPEGAQEGGLAGAGLAGQEEVAAGVADVGEGEVEFGIGGFVGRHDAKMPDRRTDFNTELLFIYPAGIDNRGGDLAFIRLLS
jgi:hypothetical protein